MPTQLQLPPPRPRLPVDPWAVALVYLPLVRLVARDFRLGPFDTDDLVSVGLIGVHDAATGGDPAWDRFQGLARVAARRRMIDWLRWHDHDRRATGDVEHALARAERVDAMDLADAGAAIGILTDRQRSAVDGHFGLQGPARTQAAIGEALGLSRMRVCRLQSRGLARLRERLGVAS